MINCCGEQNTDAYRLRRRSAQCHLCHFCDSCGAAQIVICDRVPYGGDGSCESVYLL